MSAGRRGRDRWDTCKLWIRQKHQWALDHSQWTVGQFTELGRQSVQHHKNLQRTSLGRLWDSDQKLICTCRPCRSLDLGGELVHSPLYFTYRLIHMWAEHFLGYLWVNVATAWFLAGKPPRRGAMKTNDRCDEEQTEATCVKSWKPSWKRQLYNQKMAKPRH